MEDLFLDIEAVSRSYGNIRALSEISLQVNRKEVFGLIGPDGAGKTSLFRMAATLLLPDSGKITVDGLDVVNDFRQIREMTGYMPGRFSLYHDLTVEENLSFYATVFGTSIRENYDLIKDIYSHIEPFRKRQAGKLSGGMKQKLALSCALIHRPRFLILDEPTTGVDAVSRKEFWEMLGKLKQHDITVLVSTPYMDEAMLCDRVALIQTGRIMKIGTPEAIVEEYPGRLYSVKGSNLYGLLHLLRENPSVKLAFMFGEEIHLAFREEPADPEEWLMKLTGMQDGERKIRSIPAGIEDCFVELMSETGTNAAL